MQDPATPHSMPPHGWQDIVVVDDLLPPDQHEAIYRLLSNQAWTYGWRSHDGGSAQPFWHRHFAGGSGATQTDQSSERELAGSAPALHTFWQWLAGTHLRGHALHSCYANGLPYGADGALHTDSLTAGACTAVYYPHLQWDPDWGGETLIFNREKNDIIAAIYPRPNRLLLFPGFVYHVARGVSPACPVMRITLMFKTGRPV